MFQNIYYNHFYLFLQTYFIFIFSPESFLLLTVVFFVVSHFEQVPMFIQLIVEHWYCQGSEDTGDGNC